MAEEKLETHGIRPPTMIAKTFEKLCREKVSQTHAAAAAANAALGWQ